MTSELWLSSMTHELWPSSTEAPSRTEVFSIILYETQSRSHDEQVPTTLAIFPCEADRTEHQDGREPAFLFTPDS